jgi:hypothetical protein
LFVEFAPPVRRGSQEVVPGPYKCNEISMFVKVMTQDCLMFVDLIVIFTPGFFHCCSVMVGADERAFERAHGRAPDG